MLALAVSLSHTGGFQKLNQASEVYRRFLRSFSDDPHTDVAIAGLIDVAAQVLKASEGESHTGLASHSLACGAKKGSTAEEAEACVDQAMEIPATQQLRQAIFLYEVRKEPLASGRLTGYILNGFPRFSRTDEALYYHAMTDTELGDTAGATKDLERLIAETLAI
ncbi:MAG: hypothetical protein ACREDR_19825 [Blastocatellia bacterium]